MKLQYETEAISVEIGAHMEEYNYKDASKREKSRLERQIKISVRFWDFYIHNDLHELAVIKGTLSYFMHGFWKRSGKDVYKLNIDRELWRESNAGPDQIANTRVLRFADRQKNKINFLHISLYKNEILTDEIYLDIQEAIILEATISKAMQLLTPKTDDKGWDFYEN